MTSERNWTIDFLKGISILMVFWCHSTQQIHGLDYIFSTVSHLGQLGCQLFFMISGYLAVLSYEKAGNPKEFLCKKCKNLLPAWRITLIAYATYSIIGEALLQENCFRPTEHSLMGFLMGWFCLHGIVPEFCNRLVPGGWFVGTLILLYTLTPVLSGLIQKVKNTYFPFIFFLCCALIAISLVLIKGNADIFGNNTYGYYSVLIQSSSFVLGMWTAFNEKFTGGDGSGIPFVDGSHGYSVLFASAHEFCGGAFYSEYGI